MKMYTEGHSITSVTSNVICILFFFQFNVVLGLSVDIYPVLLTVT